MRILLACAISILFSVLFACGVSYKVPTEGMKPTITPDDLIIANPLAYTFGEVERFDIVIFNAPPDVARRRGQSQGNYLIVQRVIGLPGETLEIRNNQVFINDQLLNEPFEKILDEKDYKNNFRAITLQDGEYFVMGDNRPNSEDSRYYDHPTISKKDILSKVIDIQKDVYKQN